MQNGISKQYAIFTHGFFALMAVFAVVFANERFQADGAYYLFKVINYESFQIEHQRFILIFSQALPLLGVKMHLSVSNIILLNSLSNIFFFYLVFLYVVYRLQDQTGGVAVILFQVLGVLHLQFTPMYEIWYGAVLLVPLRSHIFFERHSTAPDWLVFTALMITVLFSHPLLFIPLIFILIFSTVENWWMHWRVFIAVVISFVSWYIIKKIFLTEYEANKISMLDTSWNKAYLNLIKPAYLWAQVKYFFTYYTVPTCLFLFSLLFYLVRRARVKAMLLFCFFIGHIVVVNFTHVNDATLTPYFERMYMPLIAIAVLPFLYDIFTQLLLTNVIGGTIVALIVVWRIGRFVDVGLDYKEATAHADKAIVAATQMQGSKFELNHSDSQWCMKLMDWSFAMETMVRSAAKNPNRTITIAIWSDFDEANNRERLKNNPNEFMMRCFEVVPDTHLNPKYFKVQHGHYRYLPEVCK
jgi:hypothetical protein